MKSTLMTLFLILAAQIGMTETLSLDPAKAITMALKASDRVTAASQRVSAASKRIAGADARVLPSVGLEATAVHQSSVPEATFPESIPGLGSFTLYPNIRNTGRAGFIVTQPLWTGGATTGARKAARHQKEAATSAAKGVESALRFEARHSYWQSVETVAALEAAKAQAERAQRLLRDARSLRLAGMAVEADELGAKARLASAQLNVIQRRCQLANKVAALQSLLGLPQGTEIKFADRGSTLPPPPAKLKKLIDEALSSRPELQSLSAAHETLAEQSRIAKAATRPHLTLMGRWDLARPNQRYFPLEDTWNDSWSVGVSAAWRVFDGHRSRIEVAALDAERKAVEADRAELARRITLAVNQARRNLSTALDADAAASASVAAAGAREKASRDRYKAGLATISELLEAQSDLADAELTRARTSSGAWVAQAALLCAVGR